MNGTTPRESKASCTPFEWLTSPESLRPHIVGALRNEDASFGESMAVATSTPACNNHCQRVLHVGCGNSVLGEMLLTQPSVYPDVYQVVNVDRDADMLRQMQERWQEKQRQLLKNKNNNNSKMQRSMLFEQVDFTCEQLESWDNATFDLVLDKSTLDCLLCTNKAAAGLLTEVYRLLKPGGVYLLVSFHEHELLHPLLSNLPGADWQVSSCEMQREVEDLIRNCARTRKGDIPKTANYEYLNTESKDNSLEKDQTKENSEYRRTVNVFQCRKGQPKDPKFLCATELNWDAVYNHVHDTNDRWFRKLNPLLSRERKLQLRCAFGDESLALAHAFNVMFTDGEREHLEYHGFLEDWEAYCQAHAEVDTDRISVRDAIAFLDEMQ